MRQQANLTDSGFHYQPGGMVAWLALATYDNESLADLEPASELVNALLDRHKALIPVSLLPLLETWRDELADAIEAKSDQHDELTASVDATEVGQDRTTQDKHTGTGYGPADTSH